MAGPITLPLLSIKKTHTTSLLVALFCACILCSGQNHDEEALLTEIAEATTDSAKQRAYNRAASLFLRSDLEKAMHYVAKGEALGKDSSLTFGSAELRNTRGIIYDQLGKSAEAAADFNEAIRISEVHDYTTIAKMARNSLGLLFWKDGQFEAAINEFSEAIRLHKTLPDGDESRMANYLSNIGLIHQELKQYDKALDFHNEALSIRRKLNIPRDEAISLANMGVCYRAKGRGEEAEAAFLNAIDLAEETDFEHLYLGVHGNLGNVYFERGEYDKALRAFLTSLGDEKGQRENPKSAFHALSNLTAVMNALNRPHEAVRYGNKALDILEARPGLSAFAPPLLRSMAQSHFVIGNTDEGNAFLDRYHNAVDSVFTSRHAASLADMDVKYETVKKEEQLAVQALQIAEQKAKARTNLLIITALGVILLLAAGLFAALIGRNRRKAQIAERERKIRIQEAEAEAELRSREEERKRFARDLHDGMGQLISTLKLTVQKLSGDENIPAADRIVKKSSDLLDEMHTEIRNIAFNLMPPSLIEAGTAAAISEFAERLNTTGKIQVKTDFHGTENRQDEETEINVFRIVQEWVNNVVKYADATEVMIQLVADPEEFTVIIEDNGKGFDPEILENSQGNGWRNIRARCHFMGAAVTVDSAPGRMGTTFITEIPLRASVKTAEPLKQSAAN